MWAYDAQRGIKFHVQSTRMLKRKLYIWDPTCHNNNNKKTNCQSIHGRVGFKVPGLGVGS